MGNALLPYRAAAVEESLFKLLLRALGHTYGTPGCPDGSQCPSSNDRYITYNATNNFFYQNNGDAFQPNPDYTLHPSPLTGWFTGSKAPTDPQSQGYLAISFRTVVEHEIGHWLGMLHPNQVTSDSASCINNYTECRNSIPNYWMLMGPQGSLENLDAKGLGADDSCMFEKLYCPGTGYDGVTMQHQVPEPPSPEVFPNPTTGACQLQYEVSEHEFVQVAMYDMLGNQMRLVSSEYEEAGTRTISLGTESLLTGHYVCRVRVGENVTYINVVVER